MAGIGLRFSDDLSVSSTQPASELPGILEVQASGLAHSGKKGGKSGANVIKVVSEWRLPCLNIEGGGLDLSYAQRSSDCGCAHFTGQEESMKRSAESPGLGWTVIRGWCLLES